MFVMGLQQWYKVYNMYKLGEDQLHALWQKKSWKDQENTLSRGCSIKATTGGLWSSSPPSLQTLCHWSNPITNLWECVVVVPLRIFHGVLATNFLSVRWVGPKNFLRSQSVKTPLGGKAKIENVKFTKKCLIAKTQSVPGEGGTRKN